MKVGRVNVMNLEYFKCEKCGGVNPSSGGGTPKLMLIKCASCDHVSKFIGPFPNQDTIDALTEDLTDKPRHSSTKAMWKELGEE